MPQDTCPNHQWWWLTWLRDGGFALCMLLAFTAWLLYYRSQKWLAAIVTLLMDLLWEFLITPPPAQILELFQDYCSSCNPKNPVLWITDCVIVWITLEFSVSVDTMKILKQQTTIKLNYVINQHDPDRISFLPISMFIYYHNCYAIVAVLWDCCPPIGGFSHAMISIITI